MYTINVHPLEKSEEFFDFLKFQLCQQKQKKYCCGLSVNYFFFCLFPPPLRPPSPSSPPPLIFSLSLCLFLVPLYGLHNRRQCYGNKKKRVTSESTLLMISGAMYLPEPSIFQYHVDHCLQLEPQQQRCRRLGKKHGSNDSNRLVWLVVSSRPREHLPRFDDDSRHSSRVQTR